MLFDCGWNHVPRKDDIICQYPSYRINGLGNALDAPSAVSFRSEVPLANARPMRHQQGGVRMLQLI
jgi:hypothetical protein